MHRFLVMALMAVLWVGPAQAQSTLRILAENPVAGGCLFQNMTRWSGFDWASPPCTSADGRQPGTGTPAALRAAAERSAWRFWNGAPSLGLDGALTLVETHDEAAFDSIRLGRVVRLSGPIVAGDAARLEAVFRDNDLLLCFAEGYCPFNNVLSLDSPGGNLAEALAIARFVQAHQITILLEEGAVCESACAFIFFAGFTEYEGYFHARRFAHVTARLGVHRPNLALPDGTFAAEEVARIIALTDDVKTTAVQQFLAARVAMPVLRQMYDTPSGGMYHLTVPELESLANVFHPQNTVQTPSRAGVLSLCSGRYQALHGNTHSDLLSNLELREDSFMTWLRNGTFACYGARKPDGGWVYDLCTDADDGTCALTLCADVFNNPDSACAPVLEAANSWFIETYYNADLGIALQETTGSLCHALARVALLEQDYIGTKRMQSWTEAAPVPVAYCGALDFRAPDIARLIQGRLNDAGYDTGPVDGVLGPRSFEQMDMAGRALLGRAVVFPDAALLQALGVPRAQVDRLLLCAGQG